MASGPMIEMPGAFDMQQVVAGDEIGVTEFNTARLNIDRMLGEPTSTDFNRAFANSNNNENVNHRNATYGYGQGGVGALEAVNQNIPIEDGQFGYLQNRVQELCAFLDIPLRGNLAQDIAASSVILADDWNNLMLNIKDCWDNRFDGWKTATLMSRPSSPQNFNIPSLKSPNTVTLRFRFSNTADFYRFFILGGAVGFQFTSLGTLPPHGGAASDRFSRSVQTGDRWAHLADLVGTVRISINRVDIPVFQVGAASSELYNIDDASGAIYISQYSSSRGLPARVYRAINHYTGSLLNTITINIGIFQDVHSFYIQIGLPTHSSVRGRIMPVYWRPNASWLTDFNNPSITWVLSILRDAPSSFRNA